MPGSDTVWPVISLVAAHYHVEPIEEDEECLIWARGKDGKLYDVAAIVDAIRKRNVASTS